MATATGTAKSRAHGPDGTASDRPRQGTGTNLPVPSASLRGHQEAPWSRRRRPAPPGALLRRLVYRLAEEVATGRADVGTSPFLLVRNSPEQLYRRPSPVALSADLRATTTSRVAWREKGRRSKSPQRSSTLSPQDEKNRRISAGSQALATKDASTIASLPFPRRSRYLYRADQSCRAPTGRQLSEIDRTPAACRIWRSGGSKTSRGR